jgi:ATPase subunit of ABC transporter with duplicated ATPase domains
MIPLPNISLAAAARLGGVLLLALALILLVHDRNHWKGTAELRQQQLAQTKAAFDQTVAGYRAAAAQARAADAANAARVEAEQAAINERIEDEYQTRIAAARADARRLRDNQAAAANPGSGRAASMPGLPTPASGTAQAAGEDRLSESDRLIATEQAIQLDELIKWVRAQAAVDPNTVAPAEAGASGRECATEVAATPAEMPACAGMTVHANVH